MNRFLVPFGVICVATLLMAAEEPPTKRPGLAEEKVETKKTSTKREIDEKWGKPSGAHGKLCKYRSSEYSVTIDMPGSVFTLSLDKEKDNAPRLLQEISGVRQ